MFLLSQDDGSPGFHCDKPCPGTLLAGVAERRLGRSAGVPRPPGALLRVGTRLSRLAQLRPRSCASLVHTARRPRAGRCPGERAREGAAGPRNRLENAHIVSSATVPIAALTGRAKGLSRIHPHQQVVLSDFLTFANLVGANGISLLF